MNGDDGDDDDDPLVSHCLHIVIKLLTLTQQSRIRRVQSDHRWRVHVNLELFNQSLWIGCRKGQHLLGGRQTRVDPANVK